MASALENFVNSVRSRSSAGKLRNDGDDKELFVCKIIRHLFVFDC